ncbi:BnaC09g11130D [Brassica napus]|uniref:BnaC09g11130D protein n=1 Tax=Brassica napus TaxID=3708 RepID=A0A078GLJ3_BRANA|nr:BnaC09g11130D [Brassica napus]
MMAVLDESMILGSDGTINELLPGGGDSLWEQFFSESPGIGITDELVSRCRRWGLSFVELQQQKYNDQKEEVVVYLCIKLSFLSMCD